LGIVRSSLSCQLALMEGTTRRDALPSANAVGYESTSAFVAAFRRALGTTPGQYFKKPG